jgi:predicted RNA-binding Zn-ribbon protein involved in translation (DUF1610 family)
MPPDELPAGTCPDCGKTFCIGCAKHLTDDSGRFLCPLCGQSLKLSDDGLKKLVHDWAEGEKLESEGGRRLPGPAHT